MIGLNYSMKYLKEALTFDDVLIVPSKSSIKPSDADLSSNLTKSIKLKIPLNSNSLDISFEVAEADKSVEGTTSRPVYLLNATFSF